MGWARFDDCYTDHPKIIAAGALAELLDMRAILYCARYETDGAIPRDALARLAIGITNPKARARALVDVGRWAETATGWQVLDYLEYNPSRADKDADRAGARDRMARARSNKKTGRSSDDVRPNERRSSDNPDPTPIGNSSTDSLPRPVDNPAEEMRYRNVLDSRLGQRMRGKEIGNPVAYRLTLERELAGDRTRTLELLAEFPSAPAEAIAGHLDGEPTTLARYRRQEAHA